MVIFCAKVHRTNFWEIFSILHVIKGSPNDNEGYEVLCIITRASRFLFVVTLSGWVIDNLCILKGLINVVIMPKFPCALRRTSWVLPIMVLPFIIVRLLLPLWVRVKFNITIFLWQSNVLYLYVEFTIRELFRKGLHFFMVRLTSRRESQHSHLKCIYAHVSLKIENFNHGKCKPLI